MPTASPQTLLDIATQLVCDHFNLSKAEVLSKRKTANLVRARWCIMWLLHRVGRMGFAVIGRLLPCHHANVMHGVNEVDAAFFLPGRPQLLTPALVQAMKDALQAIRFSAVIRALPDFSPAQRRALSTALQALL